MAEPKKKCVFFDRDGVVNFRPVGDYVKTPAEFDFIPDFLNFFTHIKSLGYLAILISNQQGVGKGLMSESDLNEVSAFMQEQMLKKVKRNFDDIFYCTELKESGSFRRKPNPGMLLEAIEKWNIGTELSWMIGDSESDIIAGKKAGLRSILLTQVNQTAETAADYQSIGFRGIYSLFS